MNIRKMKSAVIDALEEIKAKNIVVLNVAKLTAMFEYIVVASGDSNRQTRALANNVRERLKETGVTIYGSEGEETGEWVLVDLGDIVVHVMQPAVREYYRLEELWREGKVEYPKPEKKGVRASRAGEVKSAKPASKSGAKSRAKQRTKARAKSHGKADTAAKPVAKPRTKAVSAASGKTAPKVKGKTVATSRRTTTGVIAKPVVRRKKAV